MWDSCRIGVTVCSRCSRVRSRPGPGGHRRAADGGGNEGVWFRLVVGARCSCAEPSRESGAVVESVVVVRRLPVAGVPPCRSAHPPRSSGVRSWAAPVGTTSAPPEIGGTPRPGRCPAGWMRWAGSEAGFALSAAQRLLDQAHRVFVPFGELRTPRVGLPAGWAVSFVGSTHSPRGELVRAVPHDG